MNIITGLPATTMLFTWLGKNTFGDDTLVVAGSEYGHSWLGQLFFFLAFLQQLRDS